MRDATGQGSPRRLILIAILAVATAPACSDADESEGGTPAGEVDTVVAADAGAVDANTTDDVAPQDTGPADVAAPDVAAVDVTASDVAPVDTTPGCLLDSECPATAKPCHAARCLANGTCTVIALDSTYCDDGLSCTIGDHCAQGTCMAGPNICGCLDDAGCASAEDGDACNGTLYCDKAKLPWQCVINLATVVECDGGSDTACAKTSCAPATGICSQSSVDDGGACDDGDPCTANESCVAGVCGGGIETCACQSDADCAKDEDGDVCNGTLYCDKASESCKLNPATVVSCPTVGDTTCVKNVCFPLTGLCQPAVVEQLVEKCADPGDAQTCAWHLAPPDSKGDGPVACDDDPCTSGDVCAGGDCKSGPDACLCKVDSDCAEQDDGDLCNGTMFCNQAVQKCQLNPATIVGCASVDDTQCAKNACDPTSGACAQTPLGLVLPEKVCTDVPGGDDQVCKWVVKAKGENEAKNLACDDANACTTGEVCVGGACTGGTETCLCKTDLDCAGEDDGNLCNGTMFCNLQNQKCELNPASIVNCPTVGDTFCQKNICQGATGVCELTPDHVNQLCDDGDDCTTGDSCKAGACASGTVTCECQVDLDCAAKEDGNLCNGTLYCDKTGDKPACQLNPASIVACNKQPESPCLAAVCNPATGQCGEIPANDAASCTDSSACTKNDQCKGGQCSGTPLDCEDNNPCTNDACDPKIGCSYGLANCSDGNDCTVDLCDADTGKCSFDAAPKDGQLCNADDSGCTVNDSCTAGTCAAGSALKCELPVKACEQAACVADGATQFECVVADKADGSPCDDGDACTVGSACLKGSCSGAGKDRFFVKALTPKGRTHGRFVAVRPAGGDAGDGFAVAGSAFDGKPDAPTQTAWWVVRTDGAGDVIWQTVTPAALDDAEVGAHALHVTGDGVAFAAGTRATALAGLQGALVRYGAAGAIEWQVEVGEVGIDESINAMVMDASGNAILVGWGEKDGERGVFATRINATGQVAWGWIKGAGTEIAQEGHAAVARPGGGAWVVGRKRFLAEKRDAALLVGYDGLGNGILDWELSTLGPALADLGFCCMAWRTTTPLGHTPADSDAPA